MEIEEIQDPECDAERWWTLAKDHPLEAMSSALFSLLTLESPGRWSKLQRTNFQPWLQVAINRLLPRARELFAADCAEHVLPLYEQTHPGDTRVRSAIAARRRYANGQLSAEEWEYARDAANDAANDAAMGGKWCEWFAADAAANTSAYPAAWSAWTARYTEQVWQWERVLLYLRGEVQ